MQIVICDDDQSVCHMLESWVKEYAKQENLILNVDKYNDAEALIKQMKQGYWFDMIFLDIELPQKTGIDLGNLIREKLGDNGPSIVFISGKLQYCQELFSMEPQNFHHKPLCKEDIVYDIRRTIQKSKIKEYVYRYIENHVPKGIPVGDIMYFKADSKYIRVVTNDNRNILIRDSIKNVSEQLEPYKICQCHKSYAVNLAYVEKYFKYEIYLRDGSIIPVGRHYVEELKKRWAKY